MKMSLFFALFFFCAAGLSSGCNKGAGKQEILSADDSKHPNPQKPRPVARALIFGDNLAVGMGARRPESLIANCLARWTGVESLVKAAPGATTHEILKQIKDANGDSAAIVFLSAGTNDVLQDLYGTGYGEEESFRNFAAILDELKNRANSRIIYLALNPPYARAGRLANLGRMAESAGLVVVDAMDGLWTQKEMMADGIHPSDAGYKLICNRLTEKLTHNHDGGDFADKATITEQVASARR